MANGNNTNWDHAGRVYNWIKQDRTEFVKELKCKGYKITGRESVKRLTEMILGHHKHLLNKTKENA